MQGGDVMKLHNFAFSPKYCDTCRKYFIFERYITYYKLLGSPGVPVKFIECAECQEKNKKAPFNFNPCD